MELPAHISLIDTTIEDAATRIDEDDVLREMVNDIGSYMLMIAQEYNLSLSTAIALSVQVGLVAGLDDWSKVWEGLSNDR